MQRFFGIAQTLEGQAVPSATVTVNLAGTATLATLYSDNAYTPLANPFTSEVDGAYQFYARNGRYDIVLTKTGYTFDNDDTANTLLDDSMSVISPAQIIANQNDYSPTNATNATNWRINSDATRSITGIVAGFSNQRITLTNIGTFNINLSHQSGSSSANNRIVSPNGRDYVLWPDATTILVYDNTSTRWRIQDFQGAMSLSDATVAGVSNTVAPTTVWTRTIPGGLLINTASVIRGGLRLTIGATFANATGAGETATVRFIYGGSTLITSAPTLALDNGITTQTSIVCDLYSFLSGAPAATMTLAGSQAAGLPEIIVNRASAVVSTAIDQTMSVTVELSAASANLTFGNLSYHLEWLP